MTAVTRVDRHATQSGGQKMSDDAQLETAIPHDPIHSECGKCGHRQFNDQIGPQPRCNQCDGWMSYAEDWQVTLAYKRMEQQIRHEQGFVTVGGYVEGVHGEESA